MHKGTENLKISAALYPQSITATEAAGTGVDMAKYNNFLAVVEQIAATQYIGNLVCVIAESTDNSTFSDTYLATTTLTSTTTGGICTVECRAEQMSDGYRYLRVEVTPSAGTVNTISAANVRFNSRFPAATLPT